MASYKFIEGVTSDVTFEAEGRDLSQLFEAASKALFDVVCEREKVRPAKKVKIRVEAEDEKSLLHSWLSALLSESDARELFFSKFKVSVKKTSKGFVAEGEVWGEPYSLEKSGTLVKGITYHNFELKKTPRGWKARVVVDI